MKLIKHIARILVGVTFIFSGFVKGIDPWGFAFKFNDYFNAMGLEWMIWAVFPLAVIMAFIEFAIGVALFFNIRIRLFSWLALLFMAYFLPFTFWTALKNPVTDCGCFGDALIISNWETFYKNIVLTILAVIVVIYRKKFKNYFNPSVVMTIGLLVIAGYIVTAIYSYRHLPVFDFRPYKAGVNIPEAMEIPADAPQDIYMSNLFYKNKKTGEVKEFSEENYPWQDTVNWEYHSSGESRLVQKGYEPPIHDFSISDNEGEDITDFFLYDEGYTFMVISYDLSKASRKNKDKLNALAHWSEENGYNFICLTPALEEEINAFKEETGAGYEFFNTDETALKTIIRSNPGLMLLQNGTILKKWHYNDIPNPEVVEEKIIQ